MNYIEISGKELLYNKNPKNFLWQLYNELLARNGKTVLSYTNIVMLTIDDFNKMEKVIIELMKEKE